MSPLITIFIGVIQKLHSSLGYSSPLEIELKGFIKSIT